MADILPRTDNRPATQQVFATVEAMLWEARNGRLFILIDDCGAVPAGYLVGAAQFVTPRMVNEMTHKARGLVCLALTAQRREQLKLPMMSATGSASKLPFTVSIEAREGVSTGISAEDRARTIACAVNTANGAEAIVTPGHIFPLVAADGGMLARAGITEAAVDIARLAGLNPTGVLSMIMNEAGDLASLEQLEGFAEAQHYRTARLSQIMEYRLARDPLLRSTGSETIDSAWGGRWKIRQYSDSISGRRSIALMKGKIDTTTPTLTRIQAANAAGDMFGAYETPAGSIERAMKHIATSVGILIVTDPLAGDRPDYIAAAQILLDHGVERVTLMRNPNDSPHELWYGCLTLADEEPFPATDTIEWAA